MLVELAVVAEAGVVAVEAAVMVVELAAVVVVVVVVVAIIVQFLVCDWASFPRSSPRCPITSDLKSNPGDPVWGEANCKPRFRGDFGCDFVAALRFQIAERTVASKRLPQKSINFELITLCKKQ